MIPMTANAQGVLWPPFQLTECVIAACGGLEVQLAQMLRNNGVVVRALVGAAAGLAFKFPGTGSLAAMEGVLANGVGRDVPVLISKVDWIRTKSALAALGCHRVIFVEDLVFPRRQWNQIFLEELPRFTESPETLAEDMAFLLSGRGGMDAAASLNAARAAIAFAQEHEIGCCGFGQGDLSMLHPLVHMFAAAAYALTPGPVIEIGGYVGGLSCTLGKLAAKAGFPVFTFEPGGAHTSHTHLPTSDILGDLRANLTASGVDRVVLLIPQPFEAAAEAVGEAKATLLVIDADGNVRDKMAWMQGRLAPGAWVIVDDYIMGGRRSQSKCFTTRAHIRELIGEGILTEMDVIGWGTWIGRYKG